MDINAARFLKSGNSLEIWRSIEPGWQFFSLTYQDRAFILSVAGTTLAPAQPDVPAVSHYKQFYQMLGAIAEYVPTLPMHWWRRSGDGKIIDLDAFCQAGHRQVYWPSNWDRFCHIFQISPLIFLGWHNGMFYIEANSQRPHYAAYMQTDHCRRAVARATRLKREREHLTLTSHVFGAYQNIATPKPASLPVP